jgi:DNA-binding FadR family transcriptional regulator
MFPANIVAVVPWPDDEQQIGRAGSSSTPLTVEQLPPLPRLPRDANANGSSSAKTASLVARLLASYIVRHQLPESTRLPTESDMRAAFGVGRTTLREALRLLETQGLIVVRAGRGGGPLVRRPRAEDLGDAMSLLLQFENTPLAELLQARYAIEPTVVALAVPRMPKDDLVKLHGNVHLSRRLTADEDHAEFVRYCRQFHTLLAEASGNSTTRSPARSATGMRPRPPWRCSITWIDLASFGEPTTPPRLPLR